MEVNNVNPTPQQSAPEQGQTYIQPPEFSGSRKGQHGRKGKTVVLKRSVFIVLICAIVAAFVVGVVVVGIYSSHVIAGYRAQAVQAEARERRSTKAYNDLIKKIKDAASSDDSDDEDSDSDDDSTQASALTIVGGKFTGVDDSGDGQAYITVKNTSNKTVSEPEIWFTYLDASGNILDEDCVDMTSDIQPGQSANLNLTDIDMSKTNAKYIQPSKILYSLDNGENIQEQKVQADKIAIR